MTGIMRAMNRTIVILGGYGAFGSVIAAHVAKLPGVSLVVGGRHAQKGAAFAQRIGATFVPCDLNDPAALHRIVAGAFMVIHAAGPFDDATHPVARACLEAGAHYCDIADSRTHVGGINQFHEHAQARGLVMYSGASTTPAITSAMVEFLTADGLRVESIQASLSPGNRNPRGAATIATILNYVGEPIAMTVGGQSVTKIGWFEGETIGLPAPIGRRRVYTVDAPDLEFFPAYFQAETVQFKAGLELSLMNRGLSLLARLRRYRLIPNLARYAGLARIFSWGLYAFGSPCGAAAVRVEGRLNDRRVLRQLAILAAQNGPLVPATPAILLARRLSAGQAFEPGAFPCIGRIGFPELAAFLSAAGMRIVQGDERGWYLEGAHTRTSL